MCFYVHISVCKPMRSLQHLLLQAHLPETPRTWSGPYGWNASPRHDSDIHRGCYMAVQSFNSPATKAGFVRPR